MQEVWHLINNVLAILDMVCILDFEIQIKPGGGVGKKYNTVIGKINGENVERKTEIRMNMT